MKLLLSIMGTDYYYLWDDDQEMERLSFIATEMEKLREQAPIYGGTEFSASSDVN